jgi:hypothetical protein
MLRWLIAVLFLANMLAFVAVRGVFGRCRRPARANRACWSGRCIRRCCGQRRSRRRPISR